MAWEQFAIAALPTVAGMFMDKPDRPDYKPPANIRMPDRSEYEAQILNAGFNPNAEIYQSAAATIADQMERQAGRRGIGGSTLAQNEKSRVLADLAQRYLQDELNRKMTALGYVQGQDAQRAQIEAGLSNQAYQDQMNAYQDQLQRQAGVVQGLSGLATAGLGAYNQGRMMDQRQQYLDSITPASTPMAPMSAPATVMPSTPAPPASSQYSLGVDYSSLGGY